VDYNKGVLFRSCLPKQKKKGGKSFEAVGGRKTVNVLLKTRAAEEEVRISRWE